jgi:hypothetical protein
MLRMMKDVWSWLERSSERRVGNDKGLAEYPAWRRREAMRRAAARSGSF